MDIVIVRKYLKDTYTIGKMFIDGEYFCDTLEDKDRGIHLGMNVSEIQKIKVYGETAIPAGMYKVIITYSNTFKRKLPLIVNVPAYTGVRIHRGNYAKDTFGCVLVGKNTAKGMVLESAKTEVALMKLLEGQDEINLIITYETDTKE